MSEQKITLADLTPAARAACLDLAALRGPRHGAALALVRVDRATRAIDTVKRYGSTGTVGRFSSSRTGATIATWSADWPVTVQAQEAAAEHRRAEAERAARLHPELVAEIEAAMPPEVQAVREAERAAQDAARAAQAATGRTAEQLWGQWAKLHRTAERLLLEWLQQDRPWAKAV